MSRPAPDLFGPKKPLLTYSEIAQLLGVTIPAVQQWKSARKIKPSVFTETGTPLFDFGLLAVALRETISLGFLPVLSKRKKRTKVQSLA